MKKVLLGTLAVFVSLAIPTQRISATEYFYSPESFENDCGCEKGSSVQCDFNANINLASDNEKLAISSFYQKCNEKIYVDSKDGCYCVRNLDVPTTKNERSIKTPINYLCLVKEAALISKEKGESLANIIFDGTTIHCDDPSPLEKFGNN